MYARRNMNGNARKNAKGPVKNETPDEEIKVSHSNVHARFMRRHNGAPIVGGATFSNAILPGKKPRFKRFPVK